MDITYCSRASCAKITCDYHPKNAPKGLDVSFGDRNDGCYNSVNLTLTEETKNQYQEADIV